MPRAPKREEDQVDGDEVVEPATEEVVTAALEEVHEDLAVEEAASAFFAEQAKSDEEEAGEGSVEQIEVEPVLDVADGEGDGGADDAPREEAEADQGSPEEEWAEPAVEAAEPEVVEEIDARTTAEKRAVFGGGLTIYTQ